MAAASIFWVISFHEPGRAELPLSPKIRAAQQRRPTTGWFMGREHGLEAKGLSMNRHSHVTPTFQSARWPVGKAAIPKLPGSWSHCERQIGRGLSMSALGEARG